MKKGAGNFEKKRKIPHPPDSNIYPKINNDFEVTQLVPRIFEINGLV
jgi:hypothetical protein